eukprot:3213058-Amphidinium_carterae.3
MSPDIVLEPMLHCATSMRFGLCSNCCFKLFIIAFQNTIPVTVFMPQLERHQFVGISQCCASCLIKRLFHLDFASVPFSAMEFGNCVPARIAQFVFLLNPPLGSSHSADDQLSEELHR